MYCELQLATEPPAQCYTRDDPHQDQDDHDVGQGGEDARYHPLATAATATPCHEGQVQPRARHSLVPPPWKLLGWWHSVHFGCTGRSFLGLGSTILLRLLSGMLRASVPPAVKFYPQAVENRSRHHTGPAPTRATGGAGDRSPARGCSPVARMDAQDRTIATFVVATQ